MVCVVTSVGHPTPCYAQEEPAADEESDRRARVLFLNGSKLYDEARYSDAIAAWKQAYRLSRRPLLLYNIANALERLGRIAEAIEYLNRYRAYASEEERETLQRRMRNLESRLSSEPNTNTLVSNNPNSETTKSVQIPVVPVILVGAGVAGMTTGLGLGLGAKSTRKSAQLFCAGEPLYCKNEASSLLKRDRRMSVGADVAVILGVAALGTGVALWVHQETKKKGVKPSVSVNVSPGGAVVHGTF